MQYLVFRLYGPMASWGEAAVGGDRPSASYPGRSALLGLLAAALGIKRSEQTRLNDLYHSVQFAVKEFSAGSLVRDYHTAQVPTADKKRLHRNRKSELSAPGYKLNTVLSSRDYRADGVWVVAIWLTEAAKVKLPELAAALVKPRFTLYLGRKSCPLAAPLNPQLLAAENLREALDYGFEPLLSSENQDTRWLQFPQQYSYYWEGAVDLLQTNNVAAVQSRQLWDEPGNRLKWQFSSRVEHQLTTSREL
jgi:CRISPR system Cascade subunit CasD